MGSSLLRAGFLQLRRAGATLCCDARASHCGGFSCCGALAQYLWRTVLAAPRHVGSSRPRAWTCVPCIGRQILNHCATREAPTGNLYWKCKYCHRNCHSTGSDYGRMYIALYATEFLTSNSSFKFPALNWIYRIEMTINPAFPRMEKIKWEDWIHNIL